MSNDEEHRQQLPPAAEETMARLVDLSSDPKLCPRSRCSTEGPTQFDVLFESIMDDVFGYDPNSKYKAWVRRLYRVGIISDIPSAWQTLEDESHP